MRATELRECLAKVGVQWSQATMAAVTARAGSAGGAAVCREWLDGLIDEDGMVDSFAELEPPKPRRLAKAKDPLHELNEGVLRNTAYASSRRTCVELARVLLPREESILDIKRPNALANHCCGFAKYFIA